MSTTRARSRRTTPSAPTNGATLAAGFLAEVDPAVRDHLSGSQTLREFLTTPDLLTLPERLLLVEQAMVLLERNYVHLDLKSAMHAIDPLQRLRLLQVRLRRQAPDTMDPGHVFHAEMSGIFHSLRDLHTNYLLPDPYRGKVAYLPFLVERCVDDTGQDTYVVSHVVQGFSQPPFDVGVAVTHWNGVPIARAVEVNGDRFAGSNRAARLARGLESLTIRPLVIHLPPDEHWVTLTYRTADGGEHTLRHDWLVVDNLPPFTDAGEISATAAMLGVDVDADEAGRARTLLFAPGVADAVRADGEGQVADAAPAAPGEDVPTTMAGVFRARAVQTSSGVFGQVRIFTFSVDDPEAFVDEFVRLIGLLPQDGLVIDVRDNGGGHIHASEFTLQTLTPHRIEPEPVQFASGDLNLAICRRHRENPTGQIDLGPWFASLDQATETGAEYSAAFPITPVADANRRGQQYHGPVVLITDARCYSATDIFAAGFADHGIGTILGVDANTGAGGANVWTHGLLTALLRFPTPDPASPYTPLPRGADMRVSMRRTLRAGPDNMGTPVEDLGVAPDELHRMTRGDVLEGNADLLDHAGEILAAQPERRLDVITDLDATGALALDIDVAGADRLDVYVDDRPRDSVDVSDGATTITVGDAAGATRVRVEAHHAGVLVAARTSPIVGEVDSDTAMAAVDRAGRRLPTTVGAAGGPPSLVYVHGAGNKPPPERLKRDWDRDLFQRDLGADSVMAYYADVLHAAPGAIGADACGVEGILAAVIAEDGDGLLSGHLPDAAPLQATDLTAFATTPEGRAFASRLGAQLRDQATARGHLREPVRGVLPLPGFLEDIILRELLRRIVPDAEAYFFNASRRDRMRSRVRAALRTAADPLIVVSHSLGTVIAYDVLHEARFAGRDVRLFVTLGSPLGYDEIQDRVHRPLRVPAPVGRWTNAADRLDVVALDGGLHNDFNGGMRLVDLRVDNVSPNNHAACGYLRPAAVRNAVTAALTTPVA